MGFFLDLTNSKVSRGYLRFLKRDYSCHDILVEVFKTSLYQGISLAEVMEDSVDEFVVGARGLVYGPNVFPEEVRLAIEPSITS